MYEKCIVKKFGSGFWSWHSDLTVIILSGPILRKSAWKYFQVIGQYMDVCAVLCFSGFDVWPWFSDYFAFDNGNLIFHRLKWSLLTYYTCQHFKILYDYTPNFNPDMIHAFMKLTIS